MQKYQLSGVNGGNMADKGLGTEIRELKLGASFSNDKSTSFHTLRYDFKPASVDLGKVATVDVGSGNQVTVTVPHLDGAGTSHTLFKGSQRQYQKECVLIFDRTTGEMTLEKLTYNIQVKKTRMESVQKLHPVTSISRTSRSQTSRSQTSRSQTSRSQTSSDLHNNTNKKSSTPPQHPPKQKKTSPKSQQIPSSLSGCIPRHSPLHASPSYPTSRSPIRPQHKSPTQSNSLSASLPLIGMDVIPELGFGNGIRFGGSQPQQQDTSRTRHSPEYETPAEEDQDGKIGILPDSSSESSSDSGCSGSDSEPELKLTMYNSPVNNVNGHVSGTSSPSLSMPDHLLNEDLQLSESGSDSD